MFSFFKKEKWVVVKTVIMTKIKWGSETDGKVFIHLFESDKGNRKIESMCSFSDVDQSKIDDYVHSTDYYQTKLFRWLNGRYDPEIPKYSETGEEDTANALRGKID